MIKKIFLPVFIIAAMGFGFYSCDKIDEPVKETTNPIPVDTTDSLTPVRKILIEDYTGHNCPNCPEAKKTLDTIEALYGDQVIGMAVHAGFFAYPDIGCLSDNFQTQAGTDFDNFFNISNGFGNPSGMVNRIGPTIPQKVIGPDDWKGAAANLVTIPPDAQIEITNTYTSSNRTVSINLDSKFLNALSGDYKLGVYLVEDSVIACQKDNSSGATIIITNYVNKYMLRGAVNSTWGEALATDPTANSIVNKSYTYVLNSTWNDKQCYVIAYIYNASTYEIIQAEREKVIP